jgi:hypothetical protein
MNGKNHDVEMQRYWQRTIGDAAGNGMSIRESSRQRRLKESQFYWWQRKLKVSGQERNTRGRVLRQTLRLTSLSVSPFLGISNDDPVTRMVRSE